MSAVPVPGPVYRPKLELRLSAKDLPRMDVTSKSDPIALVLLSENNAEPMVLGKTERISNNQNPVWQTPLQLEYKFEVFQKLIIRVGDDDDKGMDAIGQVEISVADLVALRGRPFSAVIRRSSEDKGRGSLIMTAEEVYQNVTQYKGFTISCSARNLDAKDINGKSDPYFTIQKLHNDGTNPILVRKSDVIKSTLNPEWKPEKFTIEELCNNDLNRKLLIEVWDWDKVGKHDLIGRFTTSLAELLAGMTEFKVVNPEKQAKKKHYTDSGSFKMFVKPQISLSFLQYLQSGVQLSLTVAVDFTGSNRTPTSPESLHFLGGPTLNEYQEALQKIGSIVCPYDIDQRFGLYGFGGEYQGKTSQCFPLNGNDSNPEVVGLAGLLDTYREAVAKYKLSGPTCFAPFLTEARKIAEANKKSSNTYYVVLILTDGQIDDVKESIQQIVESSDDPISIIIVGVGGADFSSMQVLDGDNGALKHGNKTAVRDVVQFVPFRKYKDDPYGLAQEVLVEVPKQLVSYYEYIGYTPQVMPPVNAGYPQPHH